jgi:hypothetical protein
MCSNHSWVAKSVATSWLGVVKILYKEKVGVNRPSWPRLNGDAKLNKVKLTEYETPKEGLFT